MSKRRAVILAVTVEGSGQAGAARRYDVSASTMSRLVARALVSAPSDLAVL